MIDYGIKASAGGKELKELPDISDFANPDDVEDLTELPSEDG
jgi:hypothetical protein